MNLIRRTAVLALASACLIPSQVYSFNMNGRVSADLYSYQGLTEDHVRPYIRFQGNAMAWRSENGRYVRLHTSLRWMTDLADKLPRDPELYVYDAYAHVSGVLQRTDLYVGRQFVYSGVGSALMDGGRIKVHPIEQLSIDIFGGSTVLSQDPETIQSLDGHLVVGGRLGAYLGRATRLGLNWMLRRRDGTASYNRIGADADRLFGPAEIYGRVSYNIVDRRLADVRARAIYRPGAWYFSGEYYWREPLVEGNSIFTIVDFYRYQIGRVEGRYRVWRNVSIAAHVQTTVSDSDDSWRTGLGFVSPMFSLAWIRQTGYAGDNDGVTGYFNYWFDDKWSVYATANLFRYRVQLEQMDRSDAYATTGGVQWRVGHGITILAEAQYLRNAVFQDDTRMLLRIAKDFSLGEEQRGWMR